MPVLLAAALHLIPFPVSVRERSCAVPLQAPLTVAASFDRGALEEIDERWRALGISALRVSSNANVRVIRESLAAQAYRLEVQPHAVTIAAADADGAFNAAMTLAQLPVRSGGAWVLPCVSIEDRPALRWRILSDDVSRGPLPNMRYFKERIRTIAAFKINGYSPYMEHVYRAPSDPLPAPLDGITPQQLHELDGYARRFHVTLIPEQQTFAHMHNTLLYEQYSAAAEQRHAFLLSPASPISIPYVARLIRSELREVPHTPFFHIGSDETAALGQGQSKPLAQRMGLSALYAQHIRQIDDIVRPFGPRIMLWDDGIENDPKIMTMIPRNAVVVNWHYGDEKTFMPYISLVQRGGFDQMVAPGDSNWNQIYPSVNTALANESRFIGEGKAAHVFGLFQTVWHDDGESLFEATWYPVLYAAAAAWENGDVPYARFRADFPAAFFGTDDARYGQDVQNLADIQSTIAESYDFSSDYLFWADPFDAHFADHMASVDVHEVRLLAEAVEQHLIASIPPLHANAARVMFLASRKFDFIGRKYQAAQEIRTQYYGPTYRGLVWTKYWFWDMRDAYEDIEPLYAAAWRYENRESHLGSNLERYHAAAQQNIERADRIYNATLTFGATKQLAPLEEILRGR